MLYQIIPVTLRHRDRIVKTFALIDSGSSASLLSQETQDLLNVEGSLKPLTLSWRNGDLQEEPDSEEVSIENMDAKGILLKLDGIRTVSKMNLPTQSVDARELKRHYQHLAGIDLESYEGTPTLLLGLPHAHLTYGKNTRVGHPGEPMSTETHLSWVVMGGKGGASQGKLLTIFEANEEVAEMQRLIRSYFSTEEFGGYAGRVERGTACIEGRVNYIPRFLVINENKPNPKPRLVFDEGPRL
ncbi:uncharacterized protein LOC131293724 [Anopheles ziemanni]|uniref:uncharacterized protein LOC131264506 n=1 Tax=Anopheles coustani TaxID=139045 RepID=UPI0026598D9D|nr:uncharacterized protein LOC131264506 [Anopheles coustani]XP_058177776.1 uncharacterized protein LOC131293724 [Anopheles ziemanni]